MIKSGCTVKGADGSGTGLSAVPPGGSDSRGRAEDDGPYMLSAPQAYFRDNYDAGRDASVHVAPTCGKMGFIYWAAVKSFAKGEKVILITPQRTVAMMFYEEAGRIWGLSSVGLRTRIESTVSDQRFIVATLKSYRSALRSGEAWTKAGLLVVDEADVHLEECGQIVGKAAAAADGVRLLLLTRSLEGAKAYASAIEGEIF